MTDHTHLDLSWRSLWRICVFAILIVIAYLARQVWGALLVAVVISLGLEPIVMFLESRKINRLLGTFIVFFLGLLVFSTIVYFIVPIVVVEIGGFVEHFDSTLSTIFGVNLPAAIVKNFSLSLDRALGFLSTINVSIAGAFSAVFSRVVLFFSTIVAAFYLTLEKDGVEKFLRVLIPDIYERPILTVFNRFKIKIRKWFGAQLILSLIIGVVVGFGMMFLGVRYPLVLGVLAGVLELVPLVGPIVTGTIAFLLAVSDSLGLGFYALLFFVGVQQLENHLLIPVVMGKAIKVHPVLVIVSILAGGQVAGFVGVVLAVPSALMAQEIFNYLSERKTERTPLGL
ncbi:AI-2E family transporter [Candidatus Jorgensenbacteria bacterium]|nr:AI-2E family transporter [Candidatus Jorgensenbacteria bacterium]